MQPPGGSAELHGFELPSVLDAAADLLHHLANRDAHGHFDQAAAVDLAGQGEDLGAAAGARAESGERGGAVAHDPGHAGQRLDVVDDGGLPAKAALHRIRRTQFRHAAAAFERLDERGLLAADERARAFADLEAQAAEVAARRRLLDGRAHMPHGQRILGADVKVALARADGVRRDGQPFEHAVRIGFEHRAIHEGAGIAFVAIADDVFDRACLRASERPLAAGGEARAAAPAQAGFGDGGDHLLRASVRAAAFQRLIAAAREVVVDIQRIDLAAVFEHDALLRRTVVAMRPGRIGRKASRRSSVRMSRIVAGARVRARSARAACGGHVAVERGLPVAVDHFHHRLAMARCRCSRRS